MLWFFTLTTYIKQKVCQYRSNTRKNVAERSAKVENANYLINNINDYTCFVQKIIKNFYKKYFCPLQYSERDLTHDTKQRYNFGEHRTVSGHFFDRTNTMF